MFGKLFVRGLVLATVFNFTTFASDETASPVSELDEMEFAESSLMVEEKVSNPISALVTNTSGKSLFELDISGSFNHIILDLKDRCNTQLSTFDTTLSTHKLDWENKLKLLEDCVTIIGEANTDYSSARTRVIELHDELVLITNNGFFSKIKSGISDTKHQEICLPLLNETIQCLWQARELLEWTIATRESTITTSSLPELCDYVARGSSVVAKIVPSAALTAKNISTYFWEVADGYGYYDHARPINDFEHRQKVEKTLGIFEQKAVMLKPFDVETEE